MIAAMSTQPMTDVDSPSVGTAAATTSPTLPHSPDVGGSPTSEKSPSTTRTAVAFSRLASPVSFR